MFICTGHSIQRFLQICILSYSSKNMSRKVYTPCSFLYSWCMTEIFKSSCLWKEFLSWYEDLTKNAVDLSTVLWSSKLALNLKFLPFWVLCIIALSFTVLWQVSAAFTYRWHHECCLKTPLVTCVDRVYRSSHPLPLAPL